MKTEQEQIEQMIKIFTDNREVCHHMRCVECKYHGDAECMYSSYAYSLYQAGYGDISEYKAEIERSKAENEVYCKQINQAYDTGYNDGYESCQDEIKQSQIDLLNKLKDSYGLYYLSAFGVKERMFADILNPMIEELKK